MRVLGVDPGTIKCGYGVIESVGSRITYVECGVITARASRPLDERQAEIMAGVRDVLAEFTPDAVGIENQFVGKNQQTAIKLAAMRGQIMEACVGLIVHVFTPATMKLMLVGRGNASKGQMQTAAKLRLGLNKMPTPDAADALAAALCMEARLRMDRRRAA